MSDFKREGRYWVFKRKHLSNADDSEFDCKTHRLMSDNKEVIPECVVVESDWPIYEDVWAMVEAVSTGTPTKIQSLEAELAAFKKDHSDVTAQLCGAIEENAELRKENGYLKRLLSAVGAAKNREEGI